MSDTPPPSGLPKPTPRWVRPFWFTFGVICVGLAFVGAALPLLPTTPFLLLAAYGFARSSKRLHDWLMAHRQFGPLIRDWRDHGAIRPRTKWISVAVMALMPPLAFLAGAPLWTLSVQIPVLLASGVFILSRPDPPPSA